MRVDDSLSESCWSIKICVYFFMHTNTYVPMYTNEHTHVHTYVNLFNTTSVYLHFLYGFIIHICICKYSYTQYKNVGDTYISWLTIGAITTTYKNYCIQMLDLLRRVSYVKTKMFGWTSPTHRTYPSVLPSATLSYTH